MKSKSKGAKSIQSPQYQSGKKAATHFGKSMKSILSKHPTKGGPR